MPDVVSDAATMSLRQMEDFMDDEHPVHGVDPMLSHHLLGHQHHHHHQQNSHHNGGSGTHPHNSLDSLHDHNDPLLSSHQHNVDISHCIDPMLANHLLGSPSSHRGHEDNDSLVSDIDMVA